MLVRQDQLKKSGSCYHFQKCLSLQKHGSWKTFQYKKVPMNQCNKYQEFNINFVFYCEKTTKLHSHKPLRSKGSAENIPF